VVLDNGRVHYFGCGILESRDHCNKELGGSFRIRGHKIQSIALAYGHSVIVTMRGDMFGFGFCNAHQLGVVDPSALSSEANIVLIPTKVFTAITKSKGSAEIQRS
jgi:hypothetical protein